MSAPLIDGQCRACGSSAGGHDNNSCPATRPATGLARRRGRTPVRRRARSVDVALPGTADWDTSGYPYCWGAGHSEYCGCRPLTSSNPLPDKDFQQ